MGRGPGIPLEIKQTIAQIFDELGNTKKARRKARIFHLEARPGFKQLSYRTLTHIYENRKEFLAMQNLPLDKRSKRKNLMRKNALDDFKLEPIDDADDAPDLKIEVYEMEESEYAENEEIVIKENGNDDVKIEVLEINTAEAESDDAEVEQSSLQEEAEPINIDFEDGTEFFIPKSMKSEIFNDAETSSPKLIELNDQSENQLRCTRCNFEAKHTLELARHKTFAHRLSCEHCAFTTNQDALLAKHILTHKDVKRFKCDICPYATKKKSDLNAHIKRHLEKRSDYQCKRCGFVTHLKSALARHKARIHKEIVLSLYS